MAEEEKKAVEEGAGEAAAAEPSDLEKSLAEKDALIEKIATERDNYKRGMLKAKGKIKPEDEDDPEESIDDKVSRLVREQMLDTQFVQAQKEKDDLVKQALARNKELETALRNRSQISTADAGSGSEQKLTVKDSVLTDDQMKALRAKGWDDAKIELYKKNLRKVS